MRCRTLSITALTAMLFLYGAMPAAAQVRLEFHDGRVNLSVQNATTRTILAEWARLGGTRILNGDRIAGPPLTLELMGVTEREALDVILRGVSGYMIASRQVAGSGASVFDRIMILPTSQAPRPAFAAAPTAPAPTFGQQVLGSLGQQGVVREDPGFDDLGDDADIPQADRFPGNPRQRVARPLLPINPAGGVNVNGMPIQNGGVPTQNGGFVPSEVDDDAEPVEPPPAPTPGNPFGVQPGSARPGVITPVAPQPTNRRPGPDVER